MGDEQVVPAIAGDHDRRFGVDRDVDRLPIGVQALAGLRVQLDETDIAEVGAVGQPQRAVGRVAEDPGIDGVAVLDAVGPDHGSRVFPFVVGRLGVERPPDQQADRRLRLRSRRRVIEEVFVADADDVRRPGVVAAARDHAGAGLPAGHSRHDAARPPPRPAVIRDGHGQAGARGVDVVLAALSDHRRRVVETRLAVEGRDWNGEETRGGHCDTPLHLRRVTLPDKATEIKTNRASSLVMARTGRATTTLARRVVPTFATRVALLGIQSLFLVFVSEACRPHSGGIDMKGMTVSRSRVTVLAFAAAAMLGSLAAVAQVKTNVPDVVVGARPAIVERIKIHGPALEGNLEGNAVDREAIVFLPPGYNQNRTLRYPVVYALHGYSIGAEQWTQGDPRAADHRGSIRQGGARDDRRAAGFEDRAQRLDVFEFGDHRRFRELRRARRGVVTSTRTIARSPAATAAAWSATPWAATARPVSA